MNNETTSAFVEYGAKKHSPVPEAAAYGFFLAAFAVLLFLNKRRAVK